VNEDRLMNVNEVAEFLGLAVGTVYHLVSQKRLPCLRLSARCLRFRKSDLNAFIDRLAKEAA
jgi:excisionase family DNA binding protein